MSRKLCAGRSMFDAPRARPLLLAAALLSAALLAAAGQGVGAPANATNDTAAGEAEAVEVSADNCECECCAPGRCDQVSTCGRCAGRARGLTEPGPAELRDGGGRLSGLLARPVQQEILCVQGPVLR